jgi:hypothetical protein
MGLKLREKYLLLVVGALTLIGLAILFITLRNNEFVTTKIHAVRDVPNRWVFAQQPYDNEFEKIQREMRSNSSDVITERRNFVKGVSCTTYLVNITF